MLIVNNIKNYLYDKNYFINIYEDYLHIFNYFKMLDFSDTKIIFEFNSFKYVIKGKNFIVIKMLEKEILIKGEILSLERINEQ